MLKFIAKLTQANTIRCSALLSSALWMLPMTAVLAQSSANMGAGIGGRDKLSPQIRETLFNQRAHIDPNILPRAAMQTRVLDSNQLTTSGHVLEGLDGQILLGAYSRFYARGIRGKEGDRFQIYRVGRPITDPVTGQAYGTEAQHLGIAHVTEGTQVRGRDYDKAITMLEVESAVEEIRPGDRLTAVFSMGQALPDTPIMPQHKVAARIIMIPRGVNEAGQRDVVVLNAGQNQRLQAGHLLRIGAHKAASRDPLTAEAVPLPDKTIGEALVFKVMPEIAYAVLLNSTHAVKIGDTLRAP